MKDQLEKAIKLANKTGDRLLIYNYREPDNTYVVMSIDEYEKIALHKGKTQNLTENELLDKINRDIANDVEDNKQVQIDDIGEEKEEKERKNNWIIPEERKDGADEVVDEDQQYLEEVSF